MGANPSRIYEDDTIVLYSTESKGFIYATPPPNSSFSHVTIYPVPSSHLEDPVFPNVHFASFQVLPANRKLDLKSYSPLAAQHTKADENKQPAPQRSLVYGRKIKLLHVASKKYLSIPHTKADDPKSISVATLVDTVTDDIKDNCQFRFLHSSSEKQRGEDVTSKDSIKLECVCKKSHHLLCTLNTIKSKYELTMAVADSTFVVYSQSFAKEEATLHRNRKTLKGGDVMLLYDVRKEVYVSGSGSKATEYLPDDIKEDKDEEVEIHQTQQGSHGTLKSPPISGDSFWQFEKTKNPLSNDAFLYGEKCRLKHLPTQQYLAVNDDQKLTLKKFTAGLWNNPHQVTFILTSAKKEVTGAIAKGDYLELKYDPTGKNLTAALCNNQTSLPAATENTLFKLVLEDIDETRQQYFKIEEVSDVVIHEYYRVSGVVSVLQECIQKFMNPNKEVLFTPVLDELNEVVQKLAEWISMPSEYQKDRTIRASMLRVTKGVDLLVGFLYEIVKETDPDSELFKLCQNICTALKKYVEGSNHKSHMYLANERLLSKLFLTIGKNIGVERVLSSLIHYERSRYCDMNY